MQIPKDAEAKWDGAAVPPESERAHAPLCIL